MAVSTLHRGDCLEVLKTLQPESLDSCVTDPPYHLTSIQKRFGGKDAAPAKEGTDGAFARASRGFMGQEWDGGDIAFQVGTWAAVYRVLKPGAYLLAFAGTRGYHRMACAIEDAGFEIRDTIHWTYYNGFPKSYDVSKGIDSQAGAEREVTGANPTFRQMQAGAAAYNLQQNPDLTAPATEAAQQWNGWGTALKPSHEIICMARKPLQEPTVAENVITYGTGAINIDACRVPGESWTPHDATGLATQKFFTRGEPVIIHKSPHAEGRWPANTILTCCGEDPHQPGCPVLLIDQQCGETKSSVRERSESGIQQFGWGLGSRQPQPRGHDDQGSASRSFMVFEPGERDPYTDALEALWAQEQEEENPDPFVCIPKPSTAEREAGCRGLPFHTAAECVIREEDSAGMQSPRAGAGRTSGRHNHHPTVKSIGLMAYLQRLVTAPGGSTLDPFMGSGTSGAAAAMEGFNYVGIELGEEYFNIAEARIKFWKGRAPGTKARRPKDTPPDHLSLFGGDL